MKYTITTASGSVYNLDIDAMKFRRVGDAPMRHNGVVNDSNPFEGWSDMVRFGSVERNALYDDFRAGRFLKHWSLAIQNPDETWNFSTAIASVEIDPA
jgi:hypothetical protein